MRPGGRFAYGQEASAEEMKKKDLIIKAQRRFEKETEALLRYEAPIVELTSNT